jgi:hypothetical protein
MSIASYVPREKIYINIYPRVIPYRDIKFRNLRDNTPASDERVKKAISTIDEYNRYRGLPIGELRISEINNKPEEVLKFISEKYTPTLANIQSRLGLFSFACRSAGLDLQYDRLYRLRESPDKIMSLVQVKKEIQKQSPDWVTEVIPALDALIKDRGYSRNARIVSLLFKYGYVMRIKSIFQTRIHGDDGVNNYLDLENGIYYMRKAKSRHTYMSFEINPDLIPVLKSLLNPYSEWLLCRDDGQPFSTTYMRLRNTGFDLYDNFTLRKSYETYNNNKPQKEREYWHIVLNHKPITALKYYVD